MLLVYFQSQKWEAVQQETVAKANTYKYTKKWEKNKTKHRWSEYSFLLVPSTLYAITSCSFAFPSVNFLVQ